MQQFACSAGCHLEVTTDENCKKECSGKSSRTSSRPCLRFWHTVEKLQLQELVKAKLQISDEEIQKSNSRSSLLEASQKPAGSGQYSRKPQAAEDNIAGR